MMNHMNHHDRIQEKIRYTYFSHDHDLVAWQVKLFDSLSENNFGMPIGIHLIIARSNLAIKKRS